MKQSSCCKNLFYRKILCLQPNNCGDFLNRASSSCGNNPRGNLSQECCNIILNPNCNISTLDSELKTDIITTK